MPESAIILDPGWDDPDDLWGLGCCMGGPVENPVTSADYAHEPGSKQWKLWKEEREAAGLPVPLGFSWFQPRDAHRVLTSHGIWMATNPKTILCFSTPRVTADISPTFERQYGEPLRGSAAIDRYGTCLGRKGSSGKTAWCEEYCYGKGQRFQESTTMEKYVSNWEFLLNVEKYPHSVLVDIADAIKQICEANKLDNLRWHGIGDLIPQELPLLDILTADGKLVIWGFTRKPQLAMKLPRRDNLVFWCSVDPTMEDRQLQQQLRASEYHGTGLAYATHIGLGTRSRSTRWRPGDKPGAKKTQKYPHGPDQYLEERLYGQGIRPSVVFGLHRGGHLTRVFSRGGLGPVPFVPSDPKENPFQYTKARARQFLSLVEHGIVVPGDECPATDPYGGGHFKGACQMCGWCVQKPGLRSRISGSGRWAVSGAPSAPAAPTLLEHRQSVVVSADTFGGKKSSWGRILLDDGGRIPAPRSGIAAGSRLLKNL